LNDVADVGAVALLLASDAGAGITGSLISVDGGTRPVWSRDSRELYFQRITQSSAFMMGVTLDMSSGLPSRPKVLFERGTQGVYDVAADGRFLVIDAVPTTQPARPITVVLNWRPEPAQ